MLDGKPYTMAGVMPPEFQFPLDTQPMDLWMSMGAAVDQESQTERGSHFLKVIGRLRNGATLEQANAETSEVATYQLASQYPDTNGHPSMGLQPEIDALVGKVQPA